MALLDSSIVIIALPAIFRGIGLNPLSSGNVGYLLWLIMGYVLVTAVLMVSVGRLGDMHGRVRIYNLGFLVFTAASIALSLDPARGQAGAMWLILWRLVQATGGSMLMANSTAILTDAFPPHKRGMAIGINQISGLAGQFIGLVAGGLLAAYDWRAVFWVNVPFGLFGTVWSYLKLRETATHSKGSVDWGGNITFALGLALVLIGITYGIQPYNDQPTGWSNPAVVGALTLGVGLLAAFAFIETRVRDPMFRLSLFRIRAFTAGSLTTFVSSIARGGMQFMLIIWLQGIWLPLHGYAFADTPLWAGIMLLPLTGGFLVAGPISGYLSDRFGARLFASTGMFLFTATFVGMIFLPTNFAYQSFAFLILLNGVGIGMYAAPNAAAIMSSVPAAHRGSASGMRSTFQNSGMSISIGVFFSLLISGLHSGLPTTLSRGLQAHGVPVGIAHDVASLPPVTSVFAAFLGYNPVQSLLGPSGVLTRLPKQSADTLTGKDFFPQLISGPFHRGLVVVFVTAAVMGFVAAAISTLRGGQYHHIEELGDGAVILPAELRPSTGTMDPDLGSTRGPEHDPAGAPLTPSSGLVAPKVTGVDAPVADRPGADGST